MPAPPLGYSLIMIMIIIIVIIINYPDMGQTIALFYFCNNFVKPRSILISSGTYVNCLLCVYISYSLYGVNQLKICFVHLLVDKTHISINHLPRF